MTTAKRLDVQEREDLVALEELEGRDIACLSLRSAGCIIQMSRRNICVDTELEHRRGSYVPLMILQKIHAADDILEMGTEWIRIAGTVMRGELRL